MQNWLDAYISALETLTADNLQQLAGLTTTDMEFRDPFNLSHGQDQFIELMADMFSRLEQVEFRVDKRISEGQSAMIHWRYSARSSATGPFSFTGMSCLEADEQGRVCLHHDYWDSAELLQKVPLLGAVLRYVRRRASHTG